MSDSIKHECGVALIRLLKPLSYYREKYQTRTYGLNKLYLLMEKQHNRGQDGAGIACVRMNARPGTPYIAIEKSNSSDPIRDVFTRVNRDAERSRRGLSCAGDPWDNDEDRFNGEILLGHLRYGTHGGNHLENCHPFRRENNWISRNLVLAGNFNLTNVDELFQLLVEIGQHPVNRSDSSTILEKIGHFLDDENGRLYSKYRAAGISRREIAAMVAANLDIRAVLTEACKKWDGGFVVAGLIGHGDAFVLRDPAGIRPAFHYQDDEVVVVASERPVIQTAFNVEESAVREIPRGRALIIRRDGAVSLELIRDELPRRSCSFERIYFSRGSDADIYTERKALGRYLTPAVLQHVGHDLGNTVFSFIPNTAETCFYGMIEALEDYCDGVKKEKILAAGRELDTKAIDDILSIRPRIEKVALKDAKLRTFITEDSKRGDLVAHVYDVTYGSVRRGLDNLVVIDDSIVRGTTLRDSILRILDRLGPKKIVLASSAPQIRYPDCYGIDMARLGDLVAFQAAIQLLKDTNQAHIIDDVHERCLKQAEFPKERIENVVKEIYRPFSDTQLSAKISELLRPVDIQAEVVIVFQSVDNLHCACPNHLGDWYFTGDYPTPGGNRVANRAFLNYVNGVDQRAYL